MKNTLRTTIIFIVYVALQTALSAKVIEADDFSHVLRNADADTLVIFDIDNTVARPEHELGSDEWFCYLVDQRVAQGYDYNTAIHLTLPVAYYITFYIPLMLTDSTLPSLITTLIDHNINVMALTSRGMYLAERTHEQLLDLDIAFSLLHSCSSDMFWQLTFPCLFRHNIIFTGNNDKGKTLLSFLEMINYHPKKVIFIDDKMYNVRSIETALLSTDIEYLGIRYTGCDHYIHNFDAAKAEAQWKALRKQLN